MIEAREFFMIILFADCNAQKYSRYMQNTNSFNCKNHTI